MESRSLAEVQRRVARVHHEADLERQLHGYDGWAPEYEQVPPRRLFGVRGCPLVWPRAGRPEAGFRRGESIRSHIGIEPPASEPSQWQGQAVRGGALFPVLFCDVFLSTCVLFPLLLFRASLLGAVDPVASVKEERATKLCKEPYLAV